MDHVADQMKLQHNVYRIPGLNSVIYCRYLVCTQKTLGHTCIAATLDDWASTKFSLGSSENGILHISLDSHHFPHELVFGDNCPISDTPT